MTKSGSAFLSRLRNRLTFWSAVMEIVAVFSLILIWIWGIHQFYVAITVSILSLAVASNALRGQGFGVIGLSWRSFPRSLRALAPALLVLAGLLLAGGEFWHTFRDVPPRTAAAGFLIYCIWGLFQQFLLNGFLLNRLMEISGGGPTRPLLMVVASVFSILHAPNWFLMAVTLPGGYFSGLLYLRHRNLLTLGLAHALLGCLLYLVIPDWISHGLYIGPNCLAFGRGR